MAKKSTTPDLFAKPIQNIEVGLIDANPDNVKVFNMNEIEELAENIAQEGFFGAIEVYDKGDGRFEISSGHRRFEAMKLLKRDTIPAVVSPMPELDTKKRRKLIAANLHNRQMTPIDYARAIEYHYDTLAMEASEKRGSKRSDINRMKEVAKYFNLTEMTVNRYLKLNKIIPELKQMVVDKQIPWTSIYVASDMSKDDQRRLYSMLQETLATKLEYDDEKGNKRRSLYAEQVAGQIRRIKSYAEKVYEGANATIPTFSEAGDVDEQGIALDLPVLDLPVLDLGESTSAISAGEYEESDEYFESGNDTAEDVVNVDGAIDGILIELNSVTSGKYTAMDKTEILKKLDEIEKKIKEIRKNL